MNELFLNNNFNSCSQVYSALNMNPVRRLQKSWSEVSKSDLETFDRIGEVMSFASNFSAYRERLKLVQEDSPCIPRVEVVLKDLTFTEEHKDITEDGKINFIKIYKLYRALQSIFSFQTLSRNYNVKFQEEEEIQQFFHHLHSLKELELDDISKKLKNNKEKPTIKNPKVDPNKNLGSPGTFKTSSTIPNPTKRQRKKSDVSKSKKKKHQLKNKKGVSLSKTFKPTSFGALMSSIDEYSDVYSEFELFLKKNQTDPYLTFYRQVTLLETSNLEEARVKKLCTSIMSQYLGIGEGNVALLSVEPLFINEISAKKDNPTPQIFLSVKEEVYSLLEAQYINFLTAEQ